MIRAIQKYDPNGITIKLDLEINNGIRSNKYVSDSCRYSQ